MNKDITYYVEDYYVHIFNINTKHCLTQVRKKLSLSLSCISL